MTRRTAVDGMFLTLAIVVSYIEVLLPIPVGIPGVKIGLANGVIMVLLFFTGWKRALFISVLRILLAGILFGNPMTIVYSLAGGILSIFFMAILKKAGGFSAVGLSVAVCLMENARIYYYAPVLLITGTIAGTAIGVLAAGLIKKIPANLFQ